MKKIYLVFIALLAPLFSLAETGEVDVKSERLSQLFSYSIIMLATAIFIIAIALLVVKISSRKEDILHSNIDRIKSELLLKGYDPNNALIDILHRESSIYKGPPVAVSEGEKEVEIVEVEAAVDHSLVLKVADELSRIQKNLAGMSEDTRGLKQLNASVNRIANNFSANGYELVQMLNKPYKEGLNAAVSFVSNDEMPEGQQIITRIIKPQVNYKGEMIQSAQIEVSVGE